jgi:hypothetical protein
MVRWQQHFDVFCIDDGIQGTAENADSALQWGENGFGRNRLHST